jgi:hypothetical protein
VQAQHPAVGQQVEVVMGSGRRCVGCEPQRAGHAQVQQQPAVVERQPEVFAAAGHRADRLAGQTLRLASQRPAQRLAQPHRLHAGAADALGKTQAGDFNFR